MLRLPDAGSRRALLLPAILILAAALRLTALLALPQVFAFEQTGQIHGSEAYDTYAQNLLATGVFGREPGVPDAAIQPLYAYALAGLYALVGRGYLQVGLFHIALDLVGITALFHIARRLFPRGAIVGALGGLFYACYPYLIFQNLTLIDTPLFMALLHLFVLAVVLLSGRPRLDRGTWTLALLAGVVFGLAMLVRSILPLFAVLVAVWFLFRLSPAQTVLRLTPVAVAGVLVVTPWMARNYRVYNQLVPMTITSGANLFQGNNPDVVPYMRAGYDPQWIGPGELENDPYSPEGDRERAQLALDYWREHPEAIPELMWVKFAAHWSIDIFPRRNPVEGQLPRLDYQGDVIVESDPSGELALGGLPQGDPVAVYGEPLFDRIGRIVHRFYFGGLLLLALAGSVLSLRRWRDVSLLWFLQLSMTVMYVLFHPSTRYRVPSDPLLFLFSAHALVVLALAVRARRGGLVRTHKTRPEYL
ncbi:MAG: glycosyltransferase family 39 protein [Chloroflexota bacterium]